MAASSSSSSDALSSGCITPSSSRAGFAHAAAVADPDDSAPLAGLFHHTRSGDVAYAAFDPVPAPTLAHLGRHGGKQPAPDPTSAAFFNEPVAALASTRGLVCLRSTATNSYYVVNPATFKCEQLPTPARDHRAKGEPQVVMVFDLHPRDSDPERGDAMEEDKPIYHHYHVVVAFPIGDGMYAFESFSSRAWKWAVADDVADAKAVEPGSGVGVLGCAFWRTSLGPFLFYEPVSRCSDLVPAPVEVTHWPHWELGEMEGTLCVTCMDASVNAVVVFQLKFGPRAACFCTLAGHFEGGCFRGRKDVKLLRSQGKAEVVMWDPSSETVVAMDIEGRTTRTIRFIPGSAYDTDFIPYVRSLAAISGSGSFMQGSLPERHSITRSTRRIKNSSPLLELRAGLSKRVSNWDEHNIFLLCTCYLDELPQDSEKLPKGAYENIKRKMLDRGANYDTGQIEQKVRNEKKRYLRWKEQGAPAPNHLHLLMKMFEPSKKTKEEKESRLTTKEGSSAAEKLPKEEINLHKQIKDLRDTVASMKLGMDKLKWHYHQDLTELGKHVSALSDAVSGYHSVLEENRKLYNELEDVKGNIRVYCRVRPFRPGENSSNSVVGMKERTITIITPSKDESKSFTFNKVFGPEATQEEVFSHMKPLIRSVLDGFNVCLFAYGQTGSGKTYTMVGPEDVTQESQGVNIRALNDLFNLQAQRKGTTDYDICVQMIEIYNEQVRDLLQDGGDNRRLEIKNKSETGLAVPDATIVRVRTLSDVLKVMKQGQKNRAVSSTAINDRSSRSHSCLIVHVQGRDLCGTILRCCMQLVDLAGSERVNKSKVVGDRLNEACFINKSLLALGDVIESLSQKKEHIPFRNSKLTQLLQDSLGGQAKTLMFVHISPEHGAVSETISTLNFAQRVASIQLGAAKQNKEGIGIRHLEEKVSTLEQENALLKAALAKKEGEPDRKGNRIPATPKDRKPMEEVGNLERTSSLQLKGGHTFRR